MNAHLSRTDPVDPTRRPIRRRRRPLRGAIVAALLLSPLLGASAAPAQRTALGLVTDGDGWGKHKDLDAQAIHAATEAFLNTRRFDVTERMELAKIFQEKSLQDVLGGESGNLFDLEGLDVLGFVSYEAEPQGYGEPPLFTLRVRLAAVGTGEVLGTFDSVRVSAFPSTSLAKAGDKLAANLRDAFPPEGIVVRVVDPKQVVVDLGTSMGIKQGDSLVLFADSEPIIHPITGEELPGQEVELGKLKVQSVGLQVATCKVTSASMPIEVTQRVRFESKTKLLQRLPKPARRLLEKVSAAAEEELREEL